MKVLVTGGTGFVGQAVVASLRAAGHPSRVLVRDPASPWARRLELNHGSELVAGDVLTPASLAPALAGCDAIIHLVGIISEVGRQTFERVHTEATQNLVAAARAAGILRFIHMSALGTRPQAMARYHQSKWSAEQALRASDLNWTIFRPSIIYGPGDGFVNLFARLSRISPVLPLIGGGRSRFKPIPVADVAHCFVAALTEERASRQTYDLAGPETLTLREIVETILRVTRRRRLLLPVPFPIARLQAALAECAFRRCLGRPPPLNRDQVTMLAEDNVGDGQPAQEVFQLVPVPFHEGIVRYLVTP